MLKIIIEVVGDGGEGGGVGLYPFFNFKEHLPCSGTRIGEAPFAVGVQFREYLFEGIAENFFGKREGDVHANTVFIGDFMAEPTFHAFSLNDDWKWFERESSEGRLDGYQQTIEQVFDFIRVERVNGHRGRLEM